MKKRVGAIVGAIVIVLVGIVLVVHHSVAGELRSHAWRVNSQWVSAKTTATFKRSKMNLVTAGVRETYRYKVYEKTDQHRIRLIGKNGVTGKNETQIFTIKKQSGKFVMKPLNATARENSGRMILSKE